MPLVIRPNPLSPNDRHVMHGEWQVGEIDTRPSPITGGSRCIRALNGVPAATPSGIRLAGATATLNEAEAELRASWEQWLAWAGLSDATERA
jgi:hypothetical protein